MGQWTAEGDGQPFGAWSGAALARLVGQIGVVQGLAGWVSGPVASGTPEANEVHTNGVLPAYPGACLVGCLRSGAFFFRHPVCSPPYFTKTVVPARGFPGFQEGRREAL